VLTVRPEASPRPHIAPAAETGYSSAT